MQVCLLNYKKGGFPFWNQFFLAPIHDSSGVVEYYLGIQSDVTEQVEGARLAQTRLEGAHCSHYYSLCQLLLLVSMTMQLGVYSIVQKSSRSMHVLDACVMVLVNNIPLI